MSRHFDVVLIGSGLSSLTAGLLLSRAGKSVLILEQYNKVGGYMHCFRRRGHRFDTGAHYVGALEPGQSFWAMLNYLGVYDPGLFTPLDPDGFDVFHFPDRTIQMKKGYAAAAQELHSHFPQERAAIDKYFQLTREAISHFPTYTYSDKPEIEMSLRFLQMSLAQVVEELTQNRELQSAFYAYCSLHGVFPQHVSFGLHSLMVDSLISGPFGFAQGGEALAERFVQKIESHGGQILCRKKVKQLVVKDKQIREVLTEDGDSFTADWVISGIHPKATWAMLGEGAPASQAFKDRMKGVEESIGIFGLYIVSKNSLELSPLRNYYFFDTSQPHDFLPPRTPSEKPGIVFACPANRMLEATSAQFPINFHAASPVEWFGDWKGSRIGHRPREYVDLKNAFSDQIIGLVDRYWPGFQANVEFRQSSSPLTNIFFNGSVDGSAFGIYHSIDNTGIRALGPRTKVLNLLLTGQNTLFPGLIAAASSGLRTSAHLLGMKPLVRDVKKLFQAETHR